MRACTRCGENLPYTVLYGHKLCRVCTAPRGWALELCETCGRLAPCQRHHPAGRVRGVPRTPDIETVCLNCHVILTVWQYNWGRGIDDEQALAQGYLDMVRLARARDHDFRCPTLVFYDRGPYLLHRLVQSARGA